MTIHVADRIPEIVLKRMRDGIEAVDTHTLFAGRAVLLFAVPGAFSPTCSAKHVPGYVEHFDALRNAVSKCGALPSTTRSWCRPGGAIR